MAKESNFEKAAGDGIGVVELKSEAERLGRELGKLRQQGFANDYILDQKNLGIEELEKRYEERVNKFIEDLEQAEIEVGQAVQEKLKIPAPEQALKEQSYKRKFALMNDNEIHSEYLRIMAGGLNADTAESEYFLLELRERDKAKFQTARDRLKQNNYDRPWRILMNQDDFRMAEAIKSRPGRNFVTLAKSEKTGATAPIYHSISDIVREPDLAAERQEAREGRLLESIQSAVSQKKARR